MSLSTVPRSPEIHIVAGHTKHIEFSDGHGASHALKFQLEYGTWIYWLEPNEANEAYLKTLEKVRVELYRVNDALTNEGQRLVPG